MGGRVASMIADDLSTEGSVTGLACLGYPFHPPGKPEQTRTAHLENIRVPSLIVQGSRDPFGTRVEVERYVLSPSVAVHWLEDGEHDLKPRQKVSGFTHGQHLDTAAESVAAFIAGTRNE